MLMTTDVAIQSQQTLVSTMDESAVCYVDESAIAACIPYMVTCMKPMYLSERYHSVLAV